LTSSKAATNPSLANSTYVTNVNNAKGIMCGIKSLQELIFIPEECVQNMCNFLYRIHSFHFPCNWQIFLTLDSTKVCMPWLVEQCLPGKCKSNI